MRIFIILTVILKLTLTISGYQLAFNNYIAGFFLSVPGIIAGISMLIFAVLFIYYEFAVIILFTAARLRGSRISIYSAMYKAWLRV
ncbi:MAG: hypothetical protein ACRC3H_14270 [Lachnospiraceae bacterium]